MVPSVPDHRMGMNRKGILMALPEGSAEDSPVAALDFARENFLLCQ